MNIRETMGRFLPSLRSRWWTLLLGVSLMFNLLVLGVIGGHFAKRDGGDRLVGASYVQLIPRQFLRELSHARRREVMEIVKSYRPDLRELKLASEETAVALAFAVEQENYDPAAIKAVVDGFSTKSSALASKGGDVVLKIMALFTPEERKQLANAIRNRGKKK
jgi:Spy/CpxP family protein refolding chaperone